MDSEPSDTPVVRAFKQGELWRWTSDAASSATQSTAQFRVASFNVERGYHVHKQAKFLSEQKFDVVLLQEVDFGCKRTQNLNICEELAKGVPGISDAVWACEFEELDSPLRTAKLAGGGWHGNGILSKFPIVNCGSIVHTQIYDWSTFKLQPRKGGRITVWADICIHKKIVRFYSSHLENFGGHVDRLRQFQEIHKHVMDTAPSTPVIIGGDINTLMHGIIRYG